MLVLTSRAGVEEIAFLAVELADAFGEVLDRVGMNEIKEDDDAEPVGFINERAQLIRSAEAAGGSEEVGDVIAEGPVVRVLGDGHELDGIVAELSDAWEDVVTELLVGADAITLGG